MPLPCGLRRITIACIEDNTRWARVIRASLRPALQQHYPAYEFDIVTLESHALLDQALQGNAVRPTTAYGHGAARMVIPDLIITDNMAKGKGGIESHVGLHWLATRDSKTSRIPTVMFSDGDIASLALILRGQPIGLVAKREAGQKDYQPFRELAEEVGRHLNLSRDNLPALTERVTRKKDPVSRGR
jgi:CheY-like chemotaxis protein